MGKSLKEQYKQLLADRITVSVDDLNENEERLIDESYDLFAEKLADIKILNDEIKRISLELANMKSMQDDEDYFNDEDQ
jgi:hypothetical protein